MLFRSKEISNSILNSRLVVKFVMATVLIRGFADTKPVWSQTVKAKGKSAAKNLPELEDD